MKVVRGAAGGSRRWTITGCRQTGESGLKTIVTRKLVCNNCDMFSKERWKAKLPKEVRGGERKGKKGVKRDGISNRAFLLYYFLSVGRGEGRG